ncbi:hypothetical protein C0J52_20309 [Blattella germanica]|uniref:Chemosensory protein n=1 Tax=Blattella germanica TaxID=6973 RepID=A0A0X8DF94_BLAGE|nr:chemosensory protein [Blattella germanica]PSN36291.1 hypothetical protein C0J52_20309 [Blattella germanica]
MKALHGSRVVRQAADPSVCPNDQMSFLSCCGKDSFHKDLEKQMTLMFSCAVELNITNMHPNNTDPFSCEVIQKQQEAMICLTECVTKKLNLMDDSGNLKEAEVKEMTKSQLSEDWKKEIADKAVTTCIEKTKNPPAAMAAGNHKCSLKPLLFGHCIWNEIHANCPEDKKIKSTMCTFVTEAMKQYQQK